MADKTKIEWTETTWNPVTGCTKISQGCKNCYAKREWPRLKANPKTVNYGREFEEVMTHPERLELPLRWKKPRRIFVNSMSDLFHESVPFEYIAAVFAIMSVTTRHTYQVLTKRPQRMLNFFKWVFDTDYIDSAWKEATNKFIADSNISEHFPDNIEWRPLGKNQGGYDNCLPSFPYQNVWLGVSVEDQQTANERIPLLLQTPAAIRWISAEPLLGLVELDNIEFEPGSFFNTLDLEEWKGALIDWVVTGGESGPGARPSHPDWFRTLRDQCKTANVPFFFKQWGEWIQDDTNATEEQDAKGTAMIMDINGNIPRIGFNRKVNNPVQLHKVGKKKAGRILDGQTWNQYPDTQ